MAADAAARMNPPDYGHFVADKGELFAGRHIIVDLWNAAGLDDPEHVRAALVAAAKAAGATVLGVNVRHFGDGGGVTGVALLAESHISIHSWPEASFAAVDIFMCGESEPSKAIPVLESRFKCEAGDVREMKRGVVAQLR